MWQIWLDRDDLFFSESSKPSARCSKIAGRTARKPSRRPGENDGNSRFDDDAALDSLFYVVPENDGTGSSWGNSSDIPFTCFDLRMEATALHRRTYQLRGIPDDFVVEGGKMEPSPGYRGRVTVFKNRLCDTTWGMRIRNAAAGAVNILSMVNDPGNLSVTVTTAAAHPLTQNDLAYISGRSNVKGFNGTWRVNAVNNATFQILSSRPTGNLFFGLKVRKLTYSFAAFTNLLLMRASHRITGRPFDAPVGKRKARSLR